MKNQGKRKDIRPRRKDIKEKENLGQQGYSAHRKKKKESREEKEKEKKKRRK